MNKRKYSINIFFNFIRLLTAKPFKSFNSHKKIKIAFIIQTWIKKRRR